MVEEEMRRKIGVSTAVVLGFIGLILGIGMTYNSDGLSSTGGLALAGTVLLFVLVMAVVGVFLAR